MADNSGGIFGGLGWSPLGWDSVPQGGSFGVTAASNAANDTGTLATTQTKTTTTTVGTTTDVATTNTQEKTTVGAGVQDWFVRGTIMFLGLIFVGIGLSMFKENIGFRFRP